MGSINQETTIGSIISGNYETAAVFRKYGIDFSCKGGSTISRICKKKQLDAGQLIEELQTIIGRQGKSGANFGSWPLELLTHYIEKEHHQYVREQIPILLKLLDEINRKHGFRHPELGEIRQLFIASSDFLLLHLEQEEDTIFPDIKWMAAAKSKSWSMLRQPSGRMRSMIKDLTRDHEEERERAIGISRLSNNYTPPEDACETYKKAFATLKQFAEGLQGHIHLENNILFPKAIQMDQELT